MRHEHLKLVAELSDGNISQTQISLPSLIFTLDGKDLTETMTARSFINEGEEEHGDGHRCGSHLPVFEKLKLEYIPSRPLSDGEHTAYIKTTDIAGNISEKTWHFTVTKM